MKKAILIASILAFSSACSTEEITKEDTANQPVPVEVVAVKKMNLEDELELTGQAIPSKTIPLVAPSPLKITEINVEVGNSVEKGDLIATLDDSTARQSVNQLANAVSELENAVDQAQSISTETKKNAKKIENLQQELNASLERSQQLLTNIDSEEVSSSDVLKESLEVAIKQAQLTQAAAQLPSVSSGNVTQLKTQLAETKSSLNQARDVLNATTIESPINGIVSQVNAEENSTAVPSTPLAVIVDMNPVVATFQANSFQISQLSKDQSVTITFDGIEGIFEGTLNSIPPTANEQTGSFVIDIQLNNEDLKIKGGMKATALIKTNEIKDAIVIPKEAVTYGENDPYVFVSQGKKVKKVTIELGAESGGNIQVLNGLTTKDDVITDGKDRLKETSEIKVQN